MNVKASLMDFGAPSERLSSHRTRTCRSASPGIRSRCVPRRRHTDHAALHDDSRHRSIRGLPRPPIRSILVVSHHLDGLTRTTGLGFVAPRSQPGFAAFHAVPSRAPAKASTSRQRNDPRSAVHTLRRIPLASSRTASPRPLPSCRSFALAAVPRRGVYRPPELADRSTDPACAEPTAIRARIRWPSHRFSRCAWPSLPPRWRVA
jgi:hypothetical protein